MAFDIHQLDDVDSYADESEEAFEQYQDTLMDLFASSPEGQARLQVDPEMGHWAAQLVYYGYNYVGVSLPQMTVGDVEIVVTELFPGKISLADPDEAGDTIPELIAFWQYLKREYGLPNADAITEVLQEVEPDFKDIMDDPSRWGMAKSFFMMGQAAGFDMTDQDEIGKFVQLYNARILAQDVVAPPPPGMPDPSSSREPKAKKKKARKAAKAARKRTRKKRR